MLRTVAIDCETPGWAAARCNGVAPKLFVIEDALLASWCFMSNLDICDGASNKAQHFIKKDQENQHVRRCDKDIKQTQARE